MKEHFPKFLFLGVMVIMTIIGNNLYGGKTGEAEAPPAIALLEHPEPPTPPPIFILSSPAAPPISSSNQLSEISSSLSNLSLPTSTSLLLARGENSENSVGDYESPAAPSAPGFNSVSPENIDLTQGFLSTPENITLRAFSQLHNFAQPLITAKAALLADLLTGETYFALNPERRWPLASVTKLVTAAVAMKYSDLNQSTTIRDRDFPIAESENLKYLRGGDSYSIKDLLKIMLLSSSNEAAEALANLKERNEFIANMNALVKEWGLVSTHFSDPSGLAAANQSTANELLKISRVIYEEYPYIFRTTQFQKLLVTELNSGRSQAVPNINIFAGRSDFLGGKTGYTDEAGENLLSVFSYRGRPIVIVILGTSDRFGETEKLLEWFKANFIRSPQ